MGKGVLTAVKNVNDIIAPALLGMDPTKQVGARLAGWLAGSGARPPAARSASCGPGARQRCGAAAPAAHLGRAAAVRLLRAHPVQCLATPLWRQKKTPLCYSVWFNENPLFAGGD